METTKKIAVIGGGAAGAMSAIQAANQGANVTLFEKNEKIGKKIYITGKGRCNVTNATSYPDFFDHLVSNPKFLYSALYTFTNEDVIAFFESAGTPIKIERGNRAFPVSDRSNDINIALEKQIRACGVHLQLHTEIVQIQRADDGFMISYQKVTSKKFGGNEEAQIDETNQIEPSQSAERIEQMHFDSVIIATGGLSYPTTGATGDGYKFAKQLGHTITPLMPALVAMDISDADLSTWEGIALKHVELNAQAGKQHWVERGEMLFTKTGISGPLVLTMSSRLAGHTNEAKLWIDWKPALSEKELDDRMLREFQETPNQSIKSILERMLPKRTVPVFLDRLDIESDRKANQISREARSTIIRQLKRFELKYAGNRSFREAVITKGGVLVKEIDPSTMQSKLVPGLYFSGEVLDVDALTGGYNLQIAFSTGYLAGMSASE